jgi:hypothetical protein
VNLVIALLATAAVLYQNAAFAGGFFWALAHGVGLFGIISFIPAALAITLLWAGYAFLRKQRIPFAPLLLTAHAVVIVLANEAILPRTPLKTAQQQRAVDAVTVRYVRDEPLMSSTGRPLGFRLKYEVIFATRGRYLVAPSAASAVGRTGPPELDFGMNTLPNVEPRPLAHDEIFPLFEKDVRYTFTIDMIPVFVRSDDETKVRCVKLVPRTTFSHDDFIAALSKVPSVPYRTFVQVESYGDGTRRVVAAEYVTSRAYDIQAIHQTFIRDPGCVT